MALLTKTRLENQETHEAELKMLQRFANGAAAEHQHDPLVHALGHALEQEASRNQHKIATESRWPSNRFQGFDGIPGYVRSVHHLQNRVMTFG